MILRHGSYLCAFLTPSEASQACFLPAQSWVSEPMKALESWRCDFTLNVVAKPTRSRPVNESFVQCGSVSQGVRAAESPSLGLFLSPSLGI